MAKTPALAGGGPPACGGGLGPRRNRARQPRGADHTWGSLEVVAVVVLGVAAVAGDWAARTIEMSRLLETVAASESGMTIAQERMSDVAVPEKGEGRPTDEETAKASAWPMWRSCPGAQACQLRNRLYVDTSASRSQDAVRCT
ncbi:MAG: hypothetical protein U0904_07890 [Candidatus Nanopelagicales bacterium]|nr:hypothetical protein [Candidatus Nanopelagicales bacterium]